LRALAWLLVAVSAAPSARADDAVPGWSEGVPRWFVAGDALGGAVLEGQLGAGYGLPHYAWAGAEARSVVTTDFGAIGAGLHAALPFLDVSACWRRNVAFAHTRLPALASHSDLTFVGPTALYDALDFDATLYVPAFAGYGSVEVNAVEVLGMRLHEHVFEEYLRVVVGRGVTDVVRLGYSLRAPTDRLLVGPVVERVGLAGRDATVWRAGGSLYFVWTRELDVGVVLTEPVAGPDRLSFYDALWGTAFVRVRWARPDP
jgi:hypothetical protein